MQRQIVSFRTVLILLWGASPQAIILLILASSLTGFLTPIGLLCTQHFLDAIVRSGLIADDGVLGADSAINAHVAHRNNAATGASDHAAGAHMVIGVRPGG